jgi:predicted acylesterase/phospholipase RssA
VIHRTGPLSLVIRASASLPGILPPVYWKGDLLVDGGLLDTVPVGVMRRLNGGGRVIAVDVAPPIRLAAGRLFATHLSGWRVLRDRLRRMPRRSRIPRLLELFSRTVAIPSLFLHRHLGPDTPADLLLTPPVDRWSSLDFKRVHAISQAGYEAAVGPVAEWWATENTRAPVPDRSS